MATVATNELQNLVIGGVFHTNPWQRGATFVSPTSGDYTADRFQYRSTGAQDFTITKDADHPTKVESGAEDSDSFQAQVTTINASLGAAEFTSIEHSIEGFMAIPLYDNPFYLTFWVKSSVAGVYCVGFQNASRTTSFVSEYTIAAPNVWQEVNIQVTHDLFGGTWEIGKLAGLRLVFTLGAGANFQGTKDIWQTANVFATSNQTNLSATSSATFQLALITCTHGIIGESFYFRDAGRELAFCQRYFQKSYNVADAPGTITAAGIAAATSFGSVDLPGLSNTNIHSMRVAPTAVWFSPVTGTADRVRNVTDTADVTIASTTGAGEGVTGYPVASGSVMANKLIEAHYTLDAEIV